MTPEQQFAIQFYVKQGFTPAQASGIVARLSVESGNNLNPAALGDKGTAYGVAQWRGDRQQGLRDWAASQGLDPSRRETQLAYVPHEMKTRETGAWQRLQGATDHAGAVNAMMDYERPAGWKTGSPQTGMHYDKTLQLAAQFAGAPVQTVSSSAPASMNPSVNVAANAPAPAQTPSKPDPYAAVAQFITAAQQDEARKRGAVQQQAAQFFGSGFLDRPSGLLGG